MLSEPSVVVVLTMKFWRIFFLSMPFFRNRTIKHQFYVNVLKQCFVIILPVTIVSSVCVFYFYNFLWRGINVEIPENLVSRPQKIWQPCIHSNFFMPTLEGAVGIDRISGKLYWPYIRYLAEWFAIYPLSYRMFCQISGILTDTWPEIRHLPGYLAWYYPVSC